MRTIAPTCSSTRPRTVHVVSAPTPAALAALCAFDEALRLQERALGIYERQEDQAAVAATLGNIGVIHESCGEYTEALVVQRRDPTDLKC